ncbi:hypothetical protein ACIBJF_44775 [Streptomyces sp. NPDC050743]|uniref:hypothetical protein n=1 Tax=Streptomyces sp. NPDC050743 TaxID=3365634 RepID=UPI0037906801
MAISISAVVLLSIVVFVLIRGGSVRMSHAVARALLGFLLASTGAAPAINDTISTVTGVIGSI